MKLIINIILLLTTIHCFGQDQKLELKEPDHQSTETSDISENSWARKPIENWLKENKVSCLGLGIIDEGKLTDIRVYGELKSGSKAPYNTIFNVASLTKPIVSMTVLKLVTLGKWDLDEPLYKYWIDPEVKNDPNHKLLTTRHVLNHETGFLNWRFLHESKKLAFDFTPGAGFNYSGEGFEYLRRALENKFGNPLEAIVNEHLFEPLGMKDSYLKWSDSIEEERFAHWHNGEGENAYHDIKMNEVNAADDLMTTIEDYGKFVTWVMNGAGFSDGLFEEMVSTHEVNGNNTGMGLGWEVHSNLGNEYALIHSGADRGVHCVAIFFPISKQGLVIMTNSDNGYQLYQKCVEDNLQLGKELWERGK